jgi:hypothetical protein
VERFISKRDSREGGPCLVSVLPSLIVNYQAYKHIFTSPSSVDREPKATHSGNARIHGMTQVTPASIAYVATQVSLESVWPTSFIMQRLIGPLCVDIIAHFLEDGHGHRFGNFLLLNPRFIRRRGGAG